MNKKQDALVPVFGALCFFLSALEFVIPKPLPFLRLGLANVPLIVALDVLSFPAFLCLAAIKVIGQAFINGTLFSYLLLFSAAGTFGAVLTMYALHGISRKLLSLVGISIAGALVSNTLQIVLGRIFIFGEGIWYIAPLLFCVGAVASLLLGLFCETFCSESEWYANILPDDKKLSIHIPEDYGQAEHPILRICTGFVLMMFLFFLSGVPAKLVILIAALILCFVEKQKIHLIALLVSSFGIIVCHSFIPIGKELFTIGRFSVTSGALLNGLEKAIILQAMIYISKWTLQVRIHFPGRFGILLNESLYIFRQLLEFKDRIHLKQLITGIDELLLSLPFIVRDAEDDELSL